MGGFKHGFLADNEIGQQRGLPIRGRPSHHATPRVNEEIRNRAVVADDRAGREASGQNGVV